MQDIPSLIRKFWEGTATAEEQQQLMTWLSEAPQRRGAEETFRALYERDLQEGTQTLPVQRSEELLDIMLTKLPQAQTLVIRPWRWIGWAAAAAACLVAGLLVWKRPDTPVVRETAVLPHKKDAIIANYGSKDTTLTLSDRSTVVLASKSFLATTFDSAERRVQLSGKARFKVTTDPSKPFTVEAGKITTRVLGTEFVIDAYNKNKVTVHLLSGKVLVTGQKAVYLTPGEEVTMWGDKVEATRRPLRSLPKPEPLAFDKTPLPDVFHRIGRKYHVTIDYDVNDIRELRFTGRFQDSDPLTMMLSVICNMNGLSYQRENGRIVIQTNK